MIPSRVWRAVLAVMCVVALAALNAFVESWLWVRVLIGALLGAALVSEMLLPRARRGWGRTADEFWHHVDGEIQRARRHERALVLVRWPVSDQFDRDTLHEFRAQLRRHDDACDIGAHHFMLLTEFGSAKATMVLERVGLPLDLPGLVVAEFPVDGLTVDGLLTAFRPVTP
jgi:hypothetical protein